MAPPPHDDVSRNWIIHEGGGWTTHYTARRIPGKVVVVACNLCAGLDGCVKCCFWVYVPNLRHRHIQLERRGWEIRSLSRWAIRGRSNLQKSSLWWNLARVGTFLKSTLQSFEQRLKKIIWFWLNQKLPHPPFNRSISQYMAVTLNGWDIRDACLVYRPTGPYWRVDVIVRATSSHTTTHHPLRMVPEMILS